MNTSGIIKSTAIMTAAAAAALSIGIGPAAGDPITVGDGDSGAFTASAVDVALTAGVTISCTSATAAGTIVAGSYNTPATIGHIASTSWSGCVALGLPVTVTQTGVWDVVVTGTPVGGVTPIEIDGVDATVTVGSGLCTLDVAGSVAAEFDSATQQLVTTGGATLGTTTSGLCFGLGGSGSFTGTYDVVM